MMENVDLPPPYSEVTDVSAPSSDVLITPQEIVKKQKIDEELLVGHPFDDRIARMAFIQKILLSLFLQALVSLVIMAPFTFSWHYWYEHPSFYALVSLIVYLFMMGVLLTSHKARTTNPYKSVLFLAYPVTYGVFISLSSIGYCTREMFVALSFYCVALFALVAYSIFIFQTSLEYRPAGGIFISTFVLVSLFVLTGQIHRLNKTYFFVFMIGMLVDCIYTVWDVQLMTSPKYRYTVAPSDVMLGVLLIRIDLIYYIVMYAKKFLRSVLGFKD